MDNNYLILVYQSCEYLNEKEASGLAMLLTKMSWKVTQAFTDIGLDKDDMYFICWQSINNFHAKYGRAEFETMKKIISMTFRRKIFDRLREFNGRTISPKTQVIYDDDLCVHNSLVLENGTKDINFKLYCDYYLSGVESHIERKTLQMLLIGYNQREISDILNIPQRTIGKHYDNFVDNYKTMLN